MYPPPKRHWPGLVAAYVLLTVVLALPGVPLYYYLEPVHKPLVIRVCTGVLLAFTLHRLVRSVRERLAGHFGDRAELSLTRDESGTTTIARIVMPVVRVAA